VLSSLSKLLRLASIVLCLIVGVSFALFAVNRTSNASQHQQQVLNNETASANGETAVAPDNGGGKSSLRRTIDEVSEAITSPFSSITEGSSSEWLTHGVDLLLALIVYGLGLGFLARAIRVRV
jgi:hypothetical protein